MKIIYLTVEDMRKEGSGKTHFIEIGQNLVKLGNELIVLLPGYHPIDNRDYGLRIKYVPTFRKNRFSYLLYEFLNIFYLSYYILTFKPDVIYSRSGLFDLMPPIISKIFNIPFIIEINGIMADEFRSRGIGKIIIKILQIAERVNFRLSKAIVCVTEGIKRELLRRYRVPENKMYVVPNGFNPEIFRPLDMQKCRQKIKLDKSAFYVGFVGSFAPWQGIDTFLEAAKIVKEKKYDNIRYILIGEGEMMSELKRMANEYNLHKEVIFTGRIPYKEVSIYINSVVVAVVTPKTQRNKIIGLSPLKLYEYLGCAKPVIASRIDGLWEIIKEGNCGYVFEPDNAEDLASKIIHAYNKRALLEEIGVRGRFLVLKKYAWENSAREIQNILKKNIQN